MLTLLGMLSSVLDDSLEFLTIVLCRAPPYRIHPAIFDAAIHAAVHPMFSSNFDTNMYFLPSKFGRVLLHDEIVDKPMPDTVYSHIMLQDWTPGMSLYVCLITYPY
jgi:hypothetical protein